MKKRIFLILILIMVMTLISCKKETTKGCEHAFQEATCTQAKKCSKCGATEGEALGHTFQKATCTQAKTCTRCGATEGEALGHTFQEATCQAPKICSRCGAAEGEALKHQYILDSQGNYYCTSCKKSVIEILGKNYFLNKFSEMDGCEYETVYYESGQGVFVPHLRAMAKYKLLKDNVTYDEKAGKYIVPIKVEKMYAIDGDKGEISYVIHSEKPGKEYVITTLEEINNNYNIYISIPESYYEKIMEIDMIISSGSFSIVGTKIFGNDITKEFRIENTYMFYESSSKEEPTINIKIDLDNFSYIKDGKFYINNNKNLELIAHYYYQALKDGMSIKEFDEWAFIAEYRHFVRELDPTNTDLAK